MKWCYYLDNGGNITGMEATKVTNDLYQNPGIKRVWFVDDEDKASLWTMVLEAIAIGVNTELIQFLSEEWGLTRESLAAYLNENKKPTMLQRDGMWKFVKDILSFGSPNEFHDWMILSANSKKVGAK